MSRRKTSRRICGYPVCWSFAPECGTPNETVLLMLDEYETLRLIDHEKMTQEECAAAMGVSRATVTGIYESARAKVADALVNGKRLRIAGGAYRIDDIPAAAEVREKEPGARRLAVTYQDGQVGQHFGRTEQFKFYDVVDGEIRKTQVVDTNGISHVSLIGFLRAADVELLLCGSIGAGARNALEMVGIELVPDLEGSETEAVAIYLPKLK